jgi:hypothetical protein
LKDETLLVFHWAQKISSKTPLEGQIIFDSYWFMKDDEAIDWKEGFPQLPLEKENKLKEVSRKG